MVGVLLISGIVVSNLLTDRLTVHNRTTAPITFTSDSFGGYANYVAACSSMEFEWDQGNGSNSGWIPPDGLRRWQGGAVEVEIPAVRGFEGPGGDRFAVLVTGAGVEETEPDSSLPACEGAPPQ
jgi:hypothetical protein